MQIGARISRNALASKGFGCAGSGLGLVLGGDSRAFSSLITLAHLESSLHFDHNKQNPPNGNGGTETKW